MKKRIGAFGFPGGARKPKPPRLPDPRSQQGGRAQKALQEPKALLVAHELKHLPDSHRL